MTLLGISRLELVEKGALHTAVEIEQQPVLWHEIANKVLDEMPAIEAFFKRMAGSGVSRVILTGAGTSAFIGLSLRRAFTDLTGLPAEAIPTTDIVSHPHDYFYPDDTTLLVSFARSGNSPESIATVSLADGICKKCFHLVFTCSGAGELANYQTDNPKYVFLLPEKANDESLAMTSSYSGMLLAGLLIARRRQHDRNMRQVKLLCSYGEKVLQKDAPLLQKIAALPFQRAVFLGSGPLFGVATESHLKLQELTDGRVICKNDTFLGFRHGPKSVVNEETLMVYLLSNVPYVQRYEIDLLDSMKQGRPPMLEMVISETKVANLGKGYAFAFSSNGQSLDEEFLSVCAVLPGQVLGFYKSLDLGLSPDNPSESGAINRVVQGVSIYPIS